MEDLLAHYIADGMTWLKLVDGSIAGLRCLAALRLDGVLKRLRQVNRRLKNEIEENNE
ncbi:hypothetical protein C4K29_3566 [Pseudomonas chlororaphis subsp. piscium]|nr:hypothetical protein C4K33_3464 [Pseudomonas chlororaphis subsp. piscium]AZC89866.1 hypothetical protein C4K29_3566 [Pseudomonas chlororaphis subsp. piscium]